MNRYDYHARLFCVCGFSTAPAFGNRWFAEKEFPRCPDCGEDSFSWDLMTGRFIAMDVVNREAWQNKGEDKPMPGVAELTAEIERLHKKYRRQLWAIVIFVAIAALPWERWL